MAGKDQVIADLDQVIRKIGIEEISGREINAICFMHRVNGRNNELKGDVGTAVTIESDVAPGGQTEVQYQGARWIAVNETGQTLSKGSAAKVAQVDGVKLILK